MTSNPKFGPKTTATEAAAALSSEIKGKTLLLTGVTPKSLGAHFASTVAAHGPKLLILAARSLPTASHTANAIHESHPDVPVRTLELNLASLKSVWGAAKEVLGWDDVDAIDVLVNNAGIMACPYARTEDGFEMQWGTNHLGHFLLANLVMEKVLAGNKGRGGRIVSVSSDGYRLSGVRWGDLGFEDGKTYNKWLAYGQSKTSNILFAVSLAEKLGGKGVTAFSLHPGVILGTGLAKHNNQQDFIDLHDLDVQQGNKQAQGFKFKTLDEGTATHVVAAFDPRIAEHNGAYLEDCQIATKEEDIRPWATDKANAERLWKISEEATGQKFQY